MALGEWLHARKLDVKVMEFCMSSCANYVFPAGSRKIVSNSAMIGFHGGLSSDDFNIIGNDKVAFDAMTPKEKIARKDEIRRGMRPLLDREAAYFKLIGVRQDVTTYGEQPRFHKLVKDGWTYDQDGFKYFGVEQIGVINTPWKPQLLTLRAEIVTITPK